jgi:hypothetical protein
MRHNLSNRLGYRKENITIRFHSATNHCARSLGRNGYRHIAGGSPDGPQFVLTRSSLSSAFSSATRLVNASTVYALHSPSGVVRQWRIPSMIVSSWCINSLLHCPANHDEREEGEGE